VSLFKAEAEDNLVARAEKVGNEVMERLEKVIGRLESTVPRPIGAEKLTELEETEDYLLTIAQSPDPAKAGLDRINEWAQTYGLPRAQKMFVDYVTRNEKRIQKMADQ
jgi:hypothetical protein